MHNYYTWGAAAGEDEKSNLQSHPFVRAVERHLYAKLIEFRSQNDLSGIVIEVRPERPQRPAADIHRSERLCVVFGENVNKAPQVLALRTDFPADLPHLNLTRSGEPRSLCLFAQDYRDLRRTLTPEKFLGRIFSWLARASLDQSHLPDQRLEPFLLSSGRVIIDYDLVAAASNDSILGIVGSIDAQKDTVYQIRKLQRTSGQIPRPPCFLPIVVKGKPWHARAINSCPHSLAQLCDLLQNVGIDLVPELRTNISQLRKRQDYEPTFLHYKWILFVRLPKKRTTDGNIESVDDIAFLILDEIGCLGQKLGVLEKIDNNWGDVLLTQTPPIDLDKVMICAVNPIPVFTPALARLCSGYDSTGEMKIAAIGAGAIGSQIIMNLARQGFGKWHIVDDDVLLPHNAARHVLSSFYITEYKATAIANEIHALYDDSDFAVPIVRNILDVSPQEDDYSRVFEGVEHVYDFSASGAVSRHLAFLEVDAPRTSVFLLSAGRSLVVLSEGKNRSVRLDDLEAQLPLLSLSKDAATDMFRGGNGQIVRYAGSCRDISVQLPQDVVAVHAGIAASHLKASVAASESSIDTWTYDRALHQVSHLSSQPCRVHVANIVNWQVRITQDAVSLMKDYRLNKLPNETGGVLLGTFDIPEKIIYVVYALASPLDSIEWPTVYRRGCKGLRKQIELIHGQTGGNLGYVGEWHSHPVGIPSVPSVLDERAHRWVAEEMAQTGHPGVMLIVGDDSSPFFLVAEV